MSAIFREKQNYRNRIFKKNSLKMEKKLDGGGGGGCFLLKVQPLTTTKREALRRGPVKLIQQVKITHSFLQSVSNLFYFIVLSLATLFYIWLSKNFSKPTSKNGEIGRLIGQYF